MLKNALYRGLFLIILMMSVQISHACINAYGADVFFLLQQPRDIVALRDELQKLEQELKVMPQDYKKQNDYAVLKMLVGEHTEAIQILQQVEVQHPGLAVTAANLGTAYELNGQLKEGLYWIQQDILRDPHLHKGTEWIHVKILEAKIRQQHDPQWLERHHVLDVDFGKQLWPEPSVNKITAYPDRAYTLSEAYNAIQTQFDERLKFVTPPDYVVGDLSQFMGDMSLHWFNEEEAFWMYEAAEKAGMKNPVVMQQRKQAISNHEFQKPQYIIARFGWQVVVSVAVSGALLVGVVMYALYRLVSWIYRRCRKA